VAHFWGLRHPDLKIPHGLAFETSDCTDASVLRITPENAVGLRIDNPP